MLLKSACVKISENCSLYSFVKKICYNYLYMDVRFFYMDEWIFCQDVEKNPHNI